MIFSCPSSIPGVWKHPKSSARVEIFRATPIAHKNLIWFDTLTQQNPALRPVSWVGLKFETSKNKLQDAHHWMQRIFLGSWCRWKLVLYSTKVQRFEDCWYNCFSVEVGIISIFCASLVLTPTLWWRLCCRSSFEGIKSGCVARLAWKFKF